MENRELRMFGMVPYNISPIQQGIQFGHAVVEYGQFVKKLYEKDKSSKIVSSLYKDWEDWADNYKTFIILNGGTTNNKIIDGQYFGSLNRHKEYLDKLGIFNVGFWEPDLGDQLTSFVFLVDERAFNKEKYPEPSKEDPQEVWDNFIKSIGGEEMWEFRKFLREFRLA
jgi:hypothetical protein